ncbi:hypothetical protein [Yimella sp. NH-Cas1]|nr:hypothetical protein [Yimella sp. NH-Cas1]MCG8655843.1 hypothetical protein [Yimella sp. NH-Cas1]
MTDPTALPNFPTSGNQNGNPSEPQAQEGQPTFAGPNDESPARDRVVEALRSVGLNPEVDEDGDVSYLLPAGEDAPEGTPEQQLFVRAIDGEPAMIRVFGQWQIGDDVPADLNKRLLAANDITLSLNIIKAGIANGNLVVTGEHLITPESDLPMLLQSTTQMVVHAVQMWHQAATSDGPHAATGGEGDGLNGQA